MREFDVTFMVSYYANPGMLKMHLLNFCELRSRYPGIADRVEFVVVDDASPLGEGVRTVNDEIKASFIATSIFEIVGEDIPWNHAAARNIGHRHAIGKWHLQADIDHIILPSQWKALFDLLPDLDVCNFYYFNRVNVDDTAHKQHTDTWLYTRASWNKFGGQDERYRGLYGQHHGHMRRVYAAVPFGGTLPVNLTRYSREDIPDASTRTLTRKSKRDRDAIKALTNKFTREGTINKPETFLSPYRHVYSVGHD